MRSRRSGKGGVLIFHYKLGGESRFRGKEEYNRKLVGLALPGQVVKAEGEKVYLKLDIDGKNGKAAYPYPWSPATGNLLYAMPQPGSDELPYLCSTFRFTLKVPISLQVLSIRKTQPNLPYI